MRYQIGLSLVLLFGIEAIVIAASQKAIPSSVKSKIDMITTKVEQKLIRSDQAWKQLKAVKPKGLASGGSYFRQAQAQFFYYHQLPFLAALYAADALKFSPIPTDPKFRRSWAILYQVSQNYPIQYLLESLASHSRLSTSTPPHFGNNWHYIIANAYQNLGWDKKALSQYRKLNVGDRYFLPGLYQSALISHELNETEKALEDLDALINEESYHISPLSLEKKAELRDYAHLAKARILYESGDFSRSVKSYRNVSRNSAVFYEALFEQAWALFLSGNPQHALGSLYGVNSPFFKNRFNPEIRVLEAIIYYWLCRYQDSRQALASFAKFDSKTVEKLRDFLNQQRLSSEKAYQLFENHILGVSSEALGVPRSVLETVATRDSMLLYRDQYAALLEEKQRFELADFVDEDSRTGIEAKLGDQIQKLRDLVGNQYLEELKSLKDQFDELYAQSEFLYVELMMSEKEKLLGRVLHADTKITKISEAKNIKGWVGRGQSWEAKYDEFWWDEVGFHIVNVSPLCQLNSLE